MRSVFEHVYVWVGSDHDGGVGAAAVLYRQGIHRTLHYHLGSSDRHTVYEAELVGITLGLELLRQERAHVSTAYLALDNQAAVESCRSRYPGPASYLLDHVQTLRRSVQKAQSDVQITVAWIPGHSDVEGNEAADVAAKEAAAGTSTVRKYLPTYLRKPLPSSASRLRQNMAAKLQNDARATWLASPRYTRLSRIDNSLPSKHYAQLTQNIPRRHAALLIQLRTGHAPLNKHLHRINCVPSPLCPRCENAPETVDHYLLFCPAYDRARLGLYFDGGPRTRGLAALLNDRKLLKPLFRYIHATGRFRDQLGSKPVPDSLEPTTPKKNARRR